MRKNIMLLHMHQSSAESKFLDSYSANGTEIVTPDLKTR